jgi:hypothetical protein
MSKIFYDYLVILEKVDTEIKCISETSEEKEELWGLVDRIVNQRVMISILDRLPLEFHEEFLNQFGKSPHSQSHIGYLNSRIEFSEDEERIEEVIKKETELLEEELLGEIRSLREGHDE